jgi:hypothetical protein
MSIAQHQTQNTMDANSKSQGLESDENSGDIRSATSVRLASRSQISHLRFWWKEIGSLILSIASLSAAIVLLAWQNSKRLADWRFPASLNTAVSSLGAFSHLFLAFAVASCISQGKWNRIRRGDSTLGVFDDFDKASRGPVGAIILLFRSIRSP